jgi:hypothetical protein
MKYYSELMRVEDVSIDLEVLKSAVRAMSYGVQSCNHDDVELAMHHISDQIDALNERLRESFNTLFEAIREDSQNEIKAKPKNKKR